MSDDDGPEIAKTVYETLFAQEVIDADAVAYALDVAVQQLRKKGVPLHRWTTFVHVGA
jgi:hypothetical protein